MHPFVLMFAVGVNFDKLFIIILAVHFFLFVLYIQIAIYLLMQHTKIKNSV
jgi:hypothetical protein